MEVAMLGAGAYLLYSYMTNSGLFAPVAAAATVAAPITAAGGYTTGLTTQPPPAVVPAPVPVQLPPAGTPPVVSSPPVQPPSAIPPAGTTGGCTNSAWSTMAAALTAMAAGTPATDINGNVVPNAPAGQLSGWQWNWFVTQKMNGQNVIGPTAAQMGSLMSACDYMALRAQFGAATGLSGLARMNVPMTWRYR